MISVIPDISTLYQMINFLILLFFLNLFLYRPIRSIIIKRKEKIENMEDDVAKASDELTSQIDAYKQGIQQARMKGIKEKQVFIDNAAKEEKEIVDKINAKAIDNFAKIKQQVADESQKAYNELEKDIDIYAKAISEKVLGREF